MTLRALFLSLLFIVPGSIHAAVTDVVVSTATASAVDNTDPANIEIFGGYTGLMGECTAPDGTSVCNACTALTVNVCGGTGPRACASRSIYPDLPLSLKFQTDTIPNTPTLKAELLISGGTAANVALLDPQSAPFAVNTDIQAKMRWSTICQAAGINSNCQGTFSGTLTVGLAESGTLAAASQQKFTVKFGYVDPDPTVSQCATSCDDTSGFCNFSVSDGDSKVYVKDTQRAQTGPGDDSQILWKGIRLYYTEVAENSTDGFEIVAPGESNYSDLDVKDRSTLVTELVNNKVEGLENEKYYNFLMVTVDEAGILGPFYNGTFDANLHRGHPGEVVGLLSDKQCFIATAAYGASWTDEVRALREFRNLFLLKSELGKDFVRFYYEHSPKAASWIADREWARTTTRVLLTPIVWFAELANGMGIWIALLATVVVGALLIRLRVVLADRWKTIFFRRSR